MEPRSQLKSTISVILPGLLGVDTVREPLRSWMGQPHQERVEILVLCPDPENLPDDPAGRLRAIDTNGLRLNEARAKAIREAGGSHVLIAEDHCLPEHASTSAILKRLDEGWEVVGPVLTAGTRHTVAAQASFVIGYGQWMMPRQAGSTTVLPGHNVVVQRSLLLNYGDSLEDELIVGAFLVGKLCRTNKAFLETEWLQRHYDPADFSKVLWIYWHVGQSFGAARTRNWPLPLRLLYPIAFPLAVARHWMRASRHYLRAGRHAGMPIPLLPVITVFAAACGLGESLGALRGMRVAANNAMITEIKPVSASMVQRG